MEEKIKVLDLFSGIGGFSYACEHLVGGFETVAFCEIDKFCQRVLRKNFPNTPIYNDVKELKNETNRFGRINIVCGGFPCQPFSLASHNRKGTEDDRYLWGEMFEISKMVKADWIIGENVVGLQSMGLEQILLDLESEGYQSQVFNIPALSCGTNHQRQRLFIISHSNGSFGSRKWFSGRMEKRNLLNNRYFDVGENAATNWESESRIHRGNDGLSKGMDTIRRKRLKALGNSVVPQVLAQIFQAIKNVEKTKKIE